MLISGAGGDGASVCSAETVSVFATGLGAETTGGGVSPQAASMKTLAINMVLLAPMVLPVISYSTLVYN